MGCGEKEMSLRRYASAGMIIHHVSDWMSRMIQESNSDKYVPPKYFEQFNDCSDTSLMTNYHCVSRQEIETYIFMIYKETIMEHEALIPAILYVQKILKNRPKLFQARPRLYSNNWKTMIGMSMLLACKMTDDFHMKNSCFHTAMHCMTLKRCNEVEALFLKLLDFKLLIKETEYHDYEDIIVSSLKLGRPDKVLLTASTDNASTASMSSGASMTSILSVDTNNDENILESLKQNECSPTKPIRRNVLKDGTVYSMKLKNNRLNILSLTRESTKNLSCDSFSSFEEDFKEVTTRTSSRGVLVKLKCVLRKLVPFQRRDSAKVCF